MPAQAVVDASVAVKWILREDGREESVRLLDSYEHGQIDLIAPSLLLAEVASVLSKRCRRKQLSAAQAREAFRLFEMRSPVLVEMRDHVPSALELSLAHQLTLCDCLYLALAIERGCGLFTADERFFMATSVAYPFVRRIREG